MSDSVIVHKIVRSSIDLVVEGKPTEDVIRIALADLLRALARAVEHSDDGKIHFPLIFPLRMSIDSETLRWNFKLVSKIENKLSGTEPTDV